MSNLFCELIMDIKLIGFEPKNIEFVYLCSSLENIDQTTYQYLNDEAFLREKQEKILKRISNEKQKYGIGINPTSIEFNTNRMYIQRGDTRLNPIFQNTRIREKAIDTELLLKTFALQGSLKNLYLCDKKYAKSEKYKSIFSECPPTLLEKMELDVLTSEDFDSIWKTVKLINKPRIFSIMRFLLSKDSLEVMEEKFAFFMPELAKIHNGDEEKDVIRKQIRSPYNDD